jgi:hemoglobin-like flavoprotein
MAITAREVALVQQSFEKLQPVGATMSELFYSRLLEADARLASLLGRRSGERHAAFVSLLTAGVLSLSDPDELARLAGRIAQDELSFLLFRRHYVSVGCALVWTLEQGMGRDFTAEVRDAWCNAYAAVAQMVRQAPAQQAAENAA